MHNNNNNNNNNNNSSNNNNNSYNSYNSSSNNNKKLHQGQIKGAVKQAQDLSGLKTDLKLDTADHLPDTCGGGVEFSAMGGKIKITNTLENRLDNACVLTLPVQ